MGRYRLVLGFSIKWKIRLNQKASKVNGTLYQLSVFQLQKRTTTSLLPRLRSKPASFSPLSTVALWEEFLASRSLAWSKPSGWIKTQLKLMIYLTATCARVSCLSATKHRAGSGKTKDQGAFQGGEGASGRTHGLLGAVEK